MNVIKKGSTLLATRGCYSDYRTEGHYKVLVGFDLTSTVSLFKFKTKPNFNEFRQRQYYCEDKFIKWLQEIGYIEKSPCKELFLGDYEFEPEIYKEDINEE